MKQLHPIQYLDLRKKIRDGDVLLFRRTSWWTRMIGVAGRSEYVHAAMAGWWRDRLMCIEMRSGGGRASLLSNLVARWPGKIDVYRVERGMRGGGWGNTSGQWPAVSGQRGERGERREEREGGSNKSQIPNPKISKSLNPQIPRPTPQTPRPSFSRAVALRAMIDITGRRYGWTNLLLAAALHLPFIRWFVWPSADDAAESRRPPFCSQAVSMALRRGGLDPVPNLTDRLTEPGDLARSTACKYLGTLM